MNSGSYWFAVHGRIQSAKPYGDQAECSMKESLDLIQKGPLDSLQGEPRRPEREW